MTQINLTAPPPNPASASAHTSHHPSVVPSLEPVSLTETVSHSFFSSITRTPTSPRPQRSSRVQKSNTPPVKVESGLRSSYRLPGRLSQAPKTSSLHRPGLPPKRALYPLPHRRTNLTSSSATTPRIDQGPLTAQNVTGPSSVTPDLKTPEPVIKMETAEDVTGPSSSLTLAHKTPEPVIKMETAEGPFSSLTSDLKTPEPVTKMEPQAVGAQQNLNPTYNSMFNKGSPAVKELMYIRHMIQKLAKEAETQGLSPPHALEVKSLLDKLSTFPWEGKIYEELRIATAVRLLTKPELFGDVIARRAEELRTRWKSGDFSPNPFVDEGDELVDSSDEEEYETSDEEDEAPQIQNLASINATQRENINECVARLIRGIKIGRGSTGTRTYSLDPRYPKRPADVFGNNGLTIGDWWPFQSFSLRDGAHGSKMGGIYGKKNHGTYSVVVSGGIYEDNDLDTGDRILYSGSKGGEDQDPTSQAPYTDATQSLVMSTKHKYPVRVLRSAKNNSRFSPSAGIRYDGLYDVESYSIKTDPEGKKFYQFVLVRRQGQPPIDRTRPTPVEMAALDRIRKM